SSEDGARWLKLFNRYAQCHLWDSPTRLIYVPFFLKATASTWFDNIESTTASWEQFEAIFKETYGRSSVRSQSAAQELQTRTQRPGETCQEYLQEVVRLCREADPSMVEEDRVNHVLKGIAEQVYYLLLMKNFKTISSITTFLQELDASLSRRVKSSSISRLPNTIPFPVYPSNELSAGAVHTFSPSSPEPQYVTRSELTSIVQEAVAAATSRRSSYHELQQFDTNRTRPYCNYCHRPGHTKNRCFRRQRFFENQRSSDFPSDSRSSSPRGS